MPPRKNTAKVSRPVSIRLPADLELAIREEALSRRGKWQTVLKALLREALGIDRGTSVEVTRRSATPLRAASRRLRQKP